MDATHQLPPRATIPKIKIQKTGGRRLLAFPKLLPASDLGDGKGDKDRLTVLPKSLIPELRQHLLVVRQRHRDNQAAGWGQVLMQHALTRKYPYADRDLSWQWVVPQQKRWQDPTSKQQGRHWLPDTSQPRESRDSQLRRVICR